MTRVYRCLCGLVTLTYCGWNGLLADVCGRDLTCLYRVNFELLDGDAGLLTSVLLPVSLATRSSLHASCEYFRFTGE